MSPPSASGGAVRAGVVVITWVLAVAAAVVSTSARAGATDQGGSSPSAWRQPLSASASVKGRVALLRAKVEVRATAPGMLATQ